jgi:D-arabinose 1-dehydrogenase-like Zn-dependent alcohol dehydrogenase
VLTELGGAKVILATVTNAKAMSVLIGGLGIDGKLLVVGVSPEAIEVSPEAIEVSPLQLIGKRALVAGWPSGRAADSEDTMRFSALEGVTPWSRLSRSPRPPKD